MARKEQPTLLALQASDCIARKLARVGGPRGYRSALGEPSSGVEISEREAAVALDHIEALHAIVDAGVKEALRLAAATDDCEPVHTHRTIAVAMKLSPSTVRRLIAKGLAEVEAALELPLAA